MRSFYHRIVGWFLPPKTLDDVFRKHSIQTTDGIYSDCPVGWLHLVDQCFYELIAHDWNRKVFQVKEKFGGLRVYIVYDNYLNLFTEIINTYETKSLTTCTVCGARASQSTAWNLPKCSIHR